MAASRKVLIAIATVVGVTLLTGCATDRQPAEALVCPECRTVTVEPMPRMVSPDEEMFAPHNLWSDTVIEHECSGCQGVLVTLLTEGRLKHTCSVCEQGGFSCPVSHK